MIIPLDQLADALIDACNLELLVSFKVLYQHDVYDFPRTKLTKRHIDCILENGHVVFVPDTPFHPDYDDTVTDWYDNLRYYNNQIWAMIDDRILDPTVPRVIQCAIHYA